MKDWTRESANHCLAVHQIPETFPGESPGSPDNEENIMSEYKFKSFIDDYGYEYPADKAHIALITDQGNYVEFLITYDNKKLTILPDHRYEKDDEYRYFEITDEEMDQFIETFPEGELSLEEQKIAFKLWESKYKDGEVITEFFPDYSWPYISQEGRTDDNPSCKIEWHTDYCENRPSPRYEQKPGWNILDEYWSFYGNLSGDFNIDWDEIEKLLTENNIEYDLVWIGDDYVLNVKTDDYQRAKQLCEEADNEE